MIAGSLTHRNDYPIPVGQHVIPVDLTPLVPRWWTAEVVLPVIDLVASVPVFILNL
jgi:hypothetical protein